MPYLPLISVRSRLRLGTYSEATVGPQKPGGLSCRAYGGAGIFIAGGTVTLTR